MAKAAIVTASDSGIGKACALQLAKAGFDIGITWHSDEQGARDTAREVESHGVRAETLQLDLSQLPQGAQVLEHLIARFGRIDVLVNNAGTMSKSAFLETSFDDWRQIFTVDVDGAFLCSQLAARQMVKQGQGGALSILPRCTNIPRYLRPAPTRRRNMLSAYSPKPWRLSWSAITFWLTLWRLGR